MLSDILPTGFHGAVNAGVGVGSTVYVAGAGPVGLATAASAHILGAAVVMVGDMNAERLQHAESVGFVPIDLTKSDNLGELIAEGRGKAGGRRRDRCVGFEARAHGKVAKRLRQPFSIPHDHQSAPQVRLGFLDSTLPKTRAPRRSRQDR